MSSSFVSVIVSLALSDGKTSTFACVRARACVRVRVRVRVCTPVCVRECVRARVRARACVSFWRAREGYIYSSDRFMIYLARSEVREGGEAPRTFLRRRVAHLPRLAPHYMLREIHTR